jgi:hypothetical protein
MTLVIRARDLLHKGKCGGMTFRECARPFCRALACLQSLLSLFSAVDLFAVGESFDQGFPSGEVSQDFFCRKITVTDRG